jgi:hypothetical protein
MICILGLGTDKDQPIHEKLLIDLRKLWGAPTCHEFKHTLQAFLSEW